MCQVSLLVYNIEIVYLEYFFRLNIDECCEVFFLIQAIIYIYPDS